MKTRSILRISALAVIVASVFSMPLFADSAAAAESSHAHATAVDTSGNTVYVDSCDGSCVASASAGTASAGADSTGGNVQAFAVSVAGQNSDQLFASVMSMVGFW